MRAALLSAAAVLCAGATAIAAVPASEEELLPAGVEVDVLPASGIAALSSACPNTTVCIYRNGDYDGDSRSYDVGSSGGTDWFSTPFPVRSVKNRFNNRRVIVGVLQGPNDIGQRICIGANDNRPGPFNPAREFMKIGGSGVDPNC